MTLENLRQKIVKSVSNYIFYGWIILLIAAVGIFVSGPGQSHTFSVFISPISKDLNLSATAISSAYGLATLVAALGLPMVGRLVDMHGARRVMGNGCSSSRVCLHRFRLCSRPGLGGLWIGCAPFSCPRFPNAKLYKYYFPLVQPKTGRCNGFNAAWFCRFYGYPSPSLSVAYRASWVASGLVLAGRFDLAFNVAANFDVAA